MYRTISTVLKGSPAQAARQISVKSISTYIQNHIQTLQEYETFQAGHTQNSCHIWCVWLMTSFYRLKGKYIFYKENYHLNSLPFQDAWRLGTGKKPI
jgi:hypothetical protein